MIERFPEKINITFMINYMPTNDDRDNQVKNNLKHVGSVYTLPMVGQMLREVDKYLVGRGREIMWDGNTEPLLGSTIDSAEQKLGALNKGGGKGGGQFQEIENHR